jgi:hypothetical protein
MQFLNSYHRGLVRSMNYNFKSSQLNIESKDIISIISECLMLNDLATGDIPDIHAGADNMTGL